jgi:hypothetical protein
MNRVADQNPHKIDESLDKIFGVGDPPACGCVTEAVPTRRVVIVDASEALGEGHETGSHPGKLVAQILRRALIGPG